MTGPRTEAYERLVLDGGWLTAAQLAMECGQSEATVDSNLHRQVRLGWVERRTVKMATSESGYRGARDRRVEFRAL
jgi:predicted transcriptional regulator